VLSSPRQSVPFRSVARRLAVQAPLASVSVTVTGAELASKPLTVVLVEGGALTNTSCCAVVASVTGSVARP